MSEATFAPPKRRILIIEDDASILHGLTHNLRFEGYEVLTSRDGEEGLALALEHAPDLVILDVMLPDINGKEVCQRVRSDSALDLVKILCISGMVEQDKVAELKAAGADDFMQKPFAIEDLIDRSCDLLDIERSVIS